MLSLKLTKIWDTQNKQKQSIKRKGNYADASYIGFCIATLLVNIHPFS